MAIREFFKISELLDILDEDFAANTDSGIFAKVFTENVKLPRTKNLTSRPCQALCDLVGCFSMKNDPLWAGMAGKVPDTTAIPASVQTCQIRA